MRKNKKLGFKADYSKFRFYEVLATFLFASSAKRHLNNIADVPLLILQGTEDEYVRPSGTLKLHKNLLRFNKADELLHEIRVMSGKHDLILEDETRESCLQLMSHFFGNK